MHNVSMLLTRTHPCNREGGSDTIITPQIKIYSQARGPHSYASILPSRKRVPEIGDMNFRDLICGLTHSQLVCRTKSSQPHMRERAVR